MTYEPTPGEVETLLAWFARYDGHVGRNEVGAMAYMALFPLVVMTDDAAGECVAQEWDRDAFVAAMGASAGDAGLSEIEFDNRRTPVFLSADLAVVTTDSAMTVGGERTETRYVDVMAKTGGEWRFKSMIQAGWGDMIRQ